MIDDDIHGIVWHRGRRVNINQDFIARHDYYNDRAIERGKREREDLKKKIQSAVNQETRYQSERITELEKELKCLQGKYNPLKSK